MIYGMASIIFCFFDFSVAAASAADADNVVDVVSRLRAAFSNLV